jgi:hypothetical protein
MALFGAESEDVQKTLLKVQSAMAISQGLQAVGESIDSFKQLGAVIQQSTAFKKIDNAVTQAAAGVQKLFKGSVDETSQGFKNLKTAMAVTGIGLLIAGVTYLISNFEELKDSISGVTEVEREQKKAQEQVTKATADFNVKLYSVESALEAAKKGTISKTDALKEYNDKLGDSVGYAGSLEQAESLMASNTANVIKSIRLRAEAQALYAIAAEKSAKSLEISEIKTTNFLQEQVAGKLTNKLNESSDKLKDKADELTKQALELDSKKVKGLAEKPKEETDAEKARKAKDAADKAKALREQRLAEEEEERKRALAKELQDELDFFEKRQAQRKNFALTAVGIDGLTNEEREKEKERQAKIDKEFEERNQLLTEESNKKGLGRVLAIKAESLLADIKLQEDAAEAKKRIGELEVEAKQASSYAIADIVSGISSIIGQNTAEGKAIAIASATIDTYLSASTIFKQAAKNPITTLNPAYPYLMAAPAVLSGIARVKQIASVQIPKGGGAGGGAGMPSLSSAAPMTPTVPTAQTTNISQQSINQLGNQAVKAYVIESDVTSNQQRIEAIRQRARFS